MDFTCDTKDLVQAIEIAARIADRKGAMPILGGALIVATEEGVTISATDLDVSVSAEVAARAVALGRALCDARRLGDVLRAVSSDEVRILADRGAVVVESAAWRCRISGMPAADFPKPRDGASPPWEAMPEGLPLAIARGFLAMSQDPTRAHICALNLERRDETGAIVATDGHRIHVARFAWPGADRPDVLLPRRAVVAFRSLIEEERCEISFGADLARVRAGGVTISAKVGEGAFPPWRTIMPDPDRISGGVTVARDDLDRMIVRALSTHARVVELSSGSSVLRCRIDDRGEIDATDEIPCLGKDAGSACFDPKLIRDWILNVSADRIRLSPLRNLDLLVLSEDGDRAVVEAYVGGVMPCRS